MGESHQTTLPDPSDSKPDSSPSPDFDFYTWQKFFSILIGNSTEEETFKYLHARDVLFEEQDCKRCEKQRDWLFQHSMCALQFVFFRVFKLIAALIQVP